MPEVDPVPIEETRLRSDRTDDFDLWEEFRSKSSDELRGLLDSRDDPIRNVAAKELQIRGERQTLVRGIELCKHEDPAIRADAAFLLGQLGTPHFPFAQESIPILRELLRHDSDAEVRSAAASGLGHLRGVEALVDVLEAIDDSEASVRLGVAFALSRMADPSAVAGLLRLARDQDAEVRSWAAYGLGARGADSEEALGALRALATDQDLDVRQEAIASLDRLQSGRTR